MAAAPLPARVSIEAYLHAGYEVDMDYVDGLLEQRHVGEYDHAALQTELVTLFRNRTGDWQVRAVVEQRVQVSATRFRVPDVCVLPLSWKRESIVRTAPLLP